MTQTELQDLNPQRTYLRLLVVFIASAVAVFGLLFRAMWVRGGGFDASAFQYWGPRAFGVIVVTTILGVLVVNCGWKTRAAFGVVAGICISFLYIWATN
jgi:hypothetical protein